MTKTIEPQRWAEFLLAFSERNRGRRARFEVFGPRGNVGEEEREAAFVSASVNERVVIITRNYRSGSKDRVMVDKIPGIRGVAVQYDIDRSEAMLELTNEKGVMTVLHFESVGDGASEGGDQVA